MPARNHCREGQRVGDDEPESLAEARPHDRKLATVMNKLLAQAFIGDDIRRARVEEVGRVGALARLATNESEAGIRRGGGDSIDPPLSTSCASQRNA